MSMQPSELRALERLLAEAGVTATVEAADQLTGGASRQTFAITTTGGAGRYVLQREQAPEPRLPRGMADEALLVTTAGRAGVPAPVVVGANPDPNQNPASDQDPDQDADPGLDRGRTGLGPSFMLSEHCEGETIARRILRDDRFGQARAALPRQLAFALAALHHRVDPDHIPWLEESNELAKFREVADELDLVSPAFELAFRWLEQNRPDKATTRRSVVHGDFRLGNLIVDEAGLAAVIDWELGHIGDPMEDLGWVCVRAWRFGGPKPVAGVGEYDEFFSAYEEASGVAVDRAAVTWWETLGTLKWGIMCGTQSNRHLSGDVPSVELAAIGPRVSEQEYDVLRLIAPTLGHAGVDDPPSEIGSGHRASPGLGTGGAEGGGRPSADDLIDAVRRFLADDVVGAAEGRTSFHARVAANALATVQRELALTEGVETRRRARLDELGFDSERELAAAIRAGTVDDRIDDVTSAVYDVVLHRLAVNNPRWIEG